MALQHRHHLPRRDLQPALSRTVADDIIHIRRRDIPPPESLRTRKAIRREDLYFVGDHVMSEPPRCHVVLIDVGTYDFLSICHNSSNFDAKVLLFFDMSDHKIVGGCSTLLAKSNKKMHFSRPDYIPCSRNRIKKCIFRDQCLAYIKKMLYLCGDFFNIQVWKMYN